MIVFVFGGVIGGLVGWYLALNYYEKLGPKQCRDCSKRDNCVYRAIATDQCNRKVNRTRNV